MNEKIIIFNAPRNSGKDFAAEYLKNHRHGCEVFSFKEELLTETVNYYGVDREWFDNVYNNRVSKESPMLEFNGKSPREAVIHVSEDIIKPREGLEYFGLCLLTSVRSSDCEVALVSDGGVANEVGDRTTWVELQPLLRAYGRDVVVVQIHRLGCTFEGDSRRYFGKGEFDIVYGPEEHTDPNEHFTINNLSKDIKVIKLYNNGSLEDFQEYLLLMFDDLLEEQI